MTSPRLLVIQPSDFDPLGRIEDWLTAAGAEIHTVAPAREPLPALDGYQGVVCLGGGMSALADGEHPWLSDVRLLLSKAVATRTPALAICLGSQLLAVATGGQVRPGDKGPEVGVLLVAKRDAAARDPLFAELPLTPDVLQFHRDEVTLLPPGAELLASSPRYVNQAFRVGSVAYGIQFHIETTPEIVLKWAELEPGEAALARPGELELKALVEAHIALAETWQPFARRFVQLCAGDLTPAVAGSRSLPLV